MQEVAVIHPLGNDSDRADYASLVGVNLVGSRGYVVGAARPDGFDGCYDALILFVADTLALTVNLFGGGYASPRRVDMQDDGFDGVVVTIFLELVDYGFRVQDDALEVDNCDLVAEAAGKGSLLSAAQGNVDQRENRQNEEKKAPPPMRTQSRVREPL